MQPAEQPAHGRAPVVIPRRGLIRPSEGFYLVFGYPLHRSLFTGIILFLVDTDTAFTEDTARFAATAHFFITGL